MNRRKRREEARKNKVPFEPQYRAEVWYKPFTPRDKYHFLNKKQEETQDENN